MSYGVVCVTALSIVASDAIGRRTCLTASLDHRLSLRPGAARVCSCPGLFLTSSPCRQLNTCFSVAIARRTAHGREPASMHQRSLFKAVVTVDPQQMVMRWCLWLTFVLACCVSIRLAAAQTSLSVPATYPCKSSIQFFDISSLQCQNCNQVGYRSVTEGC